MNQKQLNYNNESNNLNKIQGIVKYLSAICKKKIITKMTTVVQFNNEILIEKNCLIATFLVFVLLVSASFAFTNESLASTE